MVALKDPVRVAAGLVGAHRRWGEQPRVVRLDELTPPQRAIIIALVDAHKSANAAREGGDDA